MSFWQNIKRLREEKSLSQTAVAQHLGMSRQVYHNYEKGRRQPSLDMLRQLAAFYNITIDSLLDFKKKEDPPAFQPKEFKKLMEIFPSLDVDSRERLINIALFDYHQQQKEDEK